MYVYCTNYVSYIELFLYNNGKKLFEVDNYTSCQCDSIEFTLYIPLYHRYRSQMSIIKLPIILIAILNLEII